MDAAKKQDLLDKQPEKYKTLDTGKKQDLLNKQAEKYKTMDSLRKQEFLERRKEPSTVTVRMQLQIHAFNSSRRK